MNYIVWWNIDIEADSPEEAAQKALEIHRDPDSTAQVFHVHGADGILLETIDLLKQDAE